MPYATEQLIDQLITVPFKDRFIEFKTRTVTGYDETVSDKIVIKEIFAENVYEVTEDSFNDTGVVIDIGANIGGFSIYAALHGAKKVYAFEPEEDNYRILCDNIKLNELEDIIVPIKVGIFNDHATHKFTPGQGASHIKSIKKVTPENEVLISKLGSQEIETITFAEMWDLIPEPYCDVMKMDIEGSEYFIFANQPKELLDKVKYLSMEFHIGTKKQFGDMVATLTQTFKVRTLGSYKVGGQLYCDRY
jgi:FkbM family methyltransferase